MVYKDLKIGVAVLNKSRGVENSRFKEETTPAR